MYIKEGVWSHIRVIFSDDFEEEAIIDLSDACRIYLSTHIAHNIFFVSQSHIQWRYKGGCPTISSLRSKTAGMITLDKIV